MWTPAPVLASAIAVLAPDPPGRSEASLACTNPPLGGRQGTRSTRSHALGPTTQKSAIGRTSHLTQAARQPVQGRRVRQDDPVEPPNAHLGAAAAEDAAGDRRDSVGVAPQPDR